MLQNLLVSINTVAPIFVLLFIGYYLKQKEVLDDEFIKSGNKIVFSLALPCTMFLQVYNADFSEAFNYVTMLYVVVAFTILTTVSIVITPLFIKDNRRCGAFIQNSFRSNFGLLGTAMAISLFGDKGAISTVLLVPAGVLTLLICSIVVFTIFSEENKGKKINIANIIISVFKNQLIIAILIGIVIKLINISLPTIAVNSMDSLSSLATPLALLSLGAQMELDSFKNLKPVLACCAVKLLLVPLIAMPPALLFFDFSGYEIAALFFIFCTPAGISNYSLAYSMGSDYEFTGQVIVYSSVLSFITMVIGLFVFIEMGIFII